MTDTYTSLPGSLLVTKTIAGPAAGHQGTVTVQAVCNGSPLSPELSVPAGATAGTYSQTYDDITAGSTCTVHETANGSTSTVSVTTTGAGQTVAVPAAHVAEAGITDTYSLPGSLTVTKTIAGPAAGHQGTVTVQAVCNGSPLSPELSVPAGAAAGTYSHTYDGITAGSTCQVTEHADGSNKAVDVKVTGDSQHVSVPGGGTAKAALTDIYSPAPGIYSLVAGSLMVSKTIAGPGAGHQGAVSIQAACDGAALRPEFTLPAGAPAGTTSQTYDDIPPGSSCTVREITNGATPRARRHHRGRHPARHRAGG